MLEIIQRRLANKCKVTTSNNGSVIVKSGYTVIRIHSEGLSYIATELFRCFDNRRKKWFLQELHISAALELSTVLDDISMTYKIKLKDGVHA